MQSVVKAGLAPAPISNHAPVGVSALVMAAAFLASVAAADATGALGGYVFTGDELGGTITRIDLASGKSETVAIPVMPHNVQISRDGQKLLVVGGAAMEGAGDVPMTPGAEAGQGDESGRLVILNPLDPGAGPVAVYDAGADPAHVVESADGTRAFVTDAEADLVRVIDLASGETVGTIATGDFPHGLRLSPDGSAALVANAGDGTVSLIDTQDLTESARIPVGSAPVQVAFLPSGERAYVSLRDENAVAVVDVAARAVVGKVAVGRAPIQVFATPDSGRVLVANQGTRDAPEQTVSEIDVATGQVTRSVITGAGAHGVVISPDGQIAAISNSVANTVSIIDIDSGTVVQTYAVGEGPNGITYKP